MRSARNCMPSSRALAARRCSYRSAGTVEFVYDPRREEASFLEVNARLQVEHPVTEAVTGVDLAAWMLRLARGDDDVLTAHLAPGETTGAVAVRGHAVEARVYAEDPSRDYRPSAGPRSPSSSPARCRRSRSARRHLGRGGHRGVALLRSAAGQGHHRRRRPRRGARPARAARWPPPSARHRGQRRNALRGHAARRRARGPAQHRHPRRRHRPAAPDRPSTGPG